IAAGVHKVIDLDNPDAPSTITLTFENMLPRMKVVNDKLVSCQEGSSYDEQQVVYQKLISLACKDKKVEHAFLTLEYDGITWVSLYNLYEVVQSDVNKEQLDEWIPEKTARLFKHTACSPEVIGEKARHGNQPNQSPKNPMPFNHAVIHIMNLVAKWIEFK